MVYSSLFTLVCGGSVVALGGLRWFVLVYSGLWLMVVLWWFVVVCGGLW